MENVALALLLVGLGFALVSNVNLYRTPNRSLLLATIGFVFIAGTATIIHFL